MRSPCDVQCEPTSSRDRSGQPDDPLGDVLDDGCDDLAWLDDEVYPLRPELGWPTLERL